MLDVCVIGFDKAPLRLFTCGRRD